MTETDICNLAFTKIGGAGDQQGGSGFIDDINGNDPVSGRCRVLLPQCRKRVIIEMAVAECPIRETLKFADLGGALDEDELPEIGAWDYAFNLPGDCLSVAYQFDEDMTLDDQGKLKTYQFEVILNKDNNGLILLTNNLTNSDGDSAYIAYCIDQTITGIYSIPFIEAQATLLGSELCPTCGKDIKTKQQMLLEYENKSKPDLKAYSQQHVNRWTKNIPNYLGGRSTTLRSI